MCQHCDAVDLLKAAGPEKDPWRPHESLFIRELIESWTSKGLNRFGALQAELTKWLDAKGMHPSAPVGKLRHWTPGELAATKHYLEGVPPSLFTLDDWMMVVDYLFQRYLPPDVMMDEGEWLAVRAHIMGAAQAKLGAITQRQAALLLASSPFTAFDAERVVFGGAAARHESALEYGRARCCEYVTGLSDSARRRVRAAIIDWHEQKHLGVPPKDAATSLQQRLLDQFGGMNRDWRTIAITEAGENANQGFVGACAPGDRIKRHERYDGACEFCQSINGRVFTVVPADKRDKDGETEIWVGKNNVGRSMAANKRTPDGLVPRLPSERWWAPAGTVHPHCRGMWERLHSVSSDRDEHFDAWLREKLKEKK